MEHDPVEMDDGSDSDSSGSEVEEMDVNIEELEATLSANPESYDAHLQYISSLRKMGDLDKLRLAREAMNALFPLSANMWREWAKDEANLLSGAGTDDINKVEALYERGVKEYLHVPLWLDFLEFVEERDSAVAECKPEGLAKMRALCERALTAAGLHFAEGSRIWEAYREFENAVLGAMVDEDEKEKAEQAQRVRNLFFRQLAVPLANQESTLTDYVEWEKEQGVTIGNADDPFAGMDANALASYKKAEAACADYRCYEENIQPGKPADAELLQNYLVYISYEENDPARVQVLYERAITVFPVTPDVWLKYTNYLDRKLKISSLCKNVYARAVRNCSWIGELWRKYLLALERFNSGEEEISQVFEQSIQKSLQSANEYLEIFLTRLDGLRRRNASPEKLRETFQRASEYMESYFPDFVDPSLQLHKYWARTEIRLKNVESARAVWEALVKARGWMTEAWQGYIDMEVDLGNIKEVQRLYRRCYTRKFEGNGTEVICFGWLRFEREYGSLDDYDHASSKVLHRLEEVKSMQLAQEAKDSAKDAARTKKTSDEDRASKRKRGKDVKDEKKRRKVAEPEKVNDPAEKPVKEAAPIPKQKPVHTDECTAYVSNLHSTMTADDVRKIFAPCGGVTDVRLLHDRHTKASRGIAYVDFETEENLAAAVAMNKTKVDKRRIYVARSDPKGARERKMKPKAVKPLGWTAAREGEEETAPSAPPLSSNDEFRKIFLKGK